MSLTPTQQVQQLLQGTARILIATKEAYSMDGVSSSIALAEALEKMGKEVVIATHGFRILDEHTVIPNVSRVKQGVQHNRQIIVSLDIPKEEIAELRYEAAGDKINIVITPKSQTTTIENVETRHLSNTFEIVFCVDTPDLASLGKLFEDNTDLFYHTPVINIDHASVNEQYGEVNFVDTTAVATCEVVFRFLQSLSQGGAELFDEDIATCLLAGMIAKTHCFKSPNVTPRALSIASELVTRGARREEIVCQLYQTKSVETLQFWGTVLTRLRSDQSGRILWSAITSKDASNPNDEQRLIGVVEELIANMPKAEVVALFVAAEDHTITAHISALGQRDALELTKALHPEGSRQHAHVNVGSGELKPSIEKTILAIQQALSPPSSPTQNVVL